MRDRMVYHRALFAVLLSTTLLATARATVLAQTNDAESEWSRSGRITAYHNDLFGLPTLVGLAATTAYDQIRDDPEEWGEDMEGFGLRVASNGGRILVGQTTRHAVAVALGHSTRYQRCECSGFGPRVGHALLETVTDRKRSGGRALAVPRVAGAFAGAFAQMLWRPDVSSSDAAVSAGAALLYGAVVNVAGELVRW